jgi:hypothetical protein
MKWTESDTARLRKYHAESGGKLFSYLRTRVPKTSGKTIEEVALQAKYKEGCEFIIKELDDLLDAEQGADDASSGTFTSM